MKKFELLAASAIVLCFAAPAVAQNAPPPPAAQTDNEPNDDIIVTASKREGTLLDTAIAVSVVTAATIEQAQIRDLIDLQTLVPSLRVSQLQTSANTNFIIRGFGNGANNAGIEPSVGVFIDGVYRSRSAAAIGDLPDLQRVEVLRGPQSTLFGKNASAGVISIVTADPSFKYGGNLEATYGNYNAVVLKGTVTGPITDTLAFSIGGNFNKRDGYIFDAGLNQFVNDRNRWGVRGSLLFQPNAGMKFRLIADYDAINENCCGVSNVVNGPTGALIGAIGGNLDRANPLSYRVFTNFLSTNDIKNYGVSLQSDFDLGSSLALTSISAYRGSDSRTNADSDFTSADLIGNNSNVTSIQTYTQELRLTSNFEGPLNFLIGGFYFNEGIRSNGNLSYGRDFRNYANGLTGGALTALEPAFGLPAGTIGRQGLGRFDNFTYRNQALSLFASADYKLTDRLTFTAGINYTYDAKRFASNSFSTDTFSGIDLDSAPLAPLRQGLLTQGATAAGVGAQLGLPGSASAAQVAAFAGANPAAFGAIQAQAAAFGLANRNNLAANVNPLQGLKGLQFLPPFLNVPNIVEPARTSDSNFTYNLRMAYKFNDHLNVYFTYGTGFKASSINLSTDSRPAPQDFIPGSPNSNPPTSPIRAAGLALPNLTSGTRFAGPEDATVIEGGIKGSWSKASFNLAVFQQEIAGFQGNVFTGTGFVLGNAPLQSTFGIEFESNITPVRNLNLSFAATYLNPLFNSFPGGSALNAGLTVSPTDLTGRRPAGIAEWALSFGGSYVYEVSTDFRLNFRGDYQYNSPVQIADGFPLERNVQSLNMSVTGALSNGLELTIWGRNITDERFIQTIFPSVAQAGSLSGYPSQPATYGGTIRYRF